MKRAISILGEMSPDVVLKMLDQYATHLNVLKSSIDNTYVSNNESVRRVYDHNEMVLESIRKLLDDPSLTFEQKQCLIERMEKRAESSSQKDSENKNYLYQALGFIVLLFGGFVYVMLNEK